MLELVSDMMFMGPVAFIVAVGATWLCERIKEK